LLKEGLFQPKEGKFKKKPKEGRAIFKMRYLETENSF
jgi:hypothetical protein